MQSKHTRVLLFCSVAGIACATEPSSRQSSGTFPAGIYYARQVDTIDRIPQVFRIAATGGPETTIFLGAGIHFDPVVSPDGRYLAFGRQQGNTSALYLTRPGDTATAPLTPDSLFASHPAWSPSGQLLAFGAYLHGNSDVYVIHSDGTGLTRLTFQSGRQGYPTWLDDSTLALTNDSSGINQIEIMNSAGAGRHAISGNPDTITQANGSPAWSPAAGTLAFVRSGSTPISIYGMNRDGTAAHLILDPAPSSWLSWPAWSPDGTRLVAIAGGTGSRSHLVTTTTTMATNQVDTILTVPGAILSATWAP